MDDLFLVCLGGSGSKILEAVAHMAALNLWEEATLHLLMVDVDGGNGNMQRAVKTVEYYEKVRGMGVDCGQTCKLFRSELKLHTWTPTPPDINLSMMEKNVADEGSLLGRFLFTEDERVMGTENGFKGHPNIGVLFMQSIISNRNEQTKDGLEDFIAEALHIQPDRILLAGSCYGGTGASCIPILGRYLRSRLGDKIAMGLLVMLPSFSLIKDSDLEIDPDSREFPDRVKTVLSTYISEDILEYRPQAPRGAETLPMYEKIYLLGSPEPILFPQYAAGHSLQQNPATFFDWFACMAVRDYQMKATPKECGVYTAWLSQGPWNWNRFDPILCSQLEMKASKLMIAAGLYLSEIHVSMGSRLNAPSRKHPNWLSLYFQNVPVTEQQILSIQMSDFAEYVAMVVLWFYQIVMYLPGRLFPDMANKRYDCGFSPEQMEKKVGNLKLPLTEEEKKNLFMLYYQQFFNPIALLHMEKLRQRFWPDGNTRDGKTEDEHENVILAFQQIVRDGWGADEEKSLGVLLRCITRNHYYPNATADQLMGRIYENRVYTGNSDDAVPALLRRMFAMIDSMARG